MYLLITCITTFLIIPSSANEALLLSPEEWVAVSRCRLQCLEKFLVSTGYILTENSCVTDAYGCFDCWKTCQNVLTKPSQYASTCEIAKTNDDAECTPGCNAACDSLDSLDKRFYASPGSNPDLIAPPEIEFYNTTLFNLTYRDIDMTTGQYVSVTLYRLNEASQWQQLISTFQQPIPIYGSFYKYPSLQLRIITVTSKGVIGDYTLNIYERASKVTNPPTTTTSTTTTTRSSTTHLPSVNKPSGSATSPTTTSPTTKPTTDSLSDYERMFNHFFRNELILDISQDEMVDNNVKASAMSNTIMYVVVVAVCVLVLVIAIVGIVILRSNNQLAKSLSQRARSFRTSFRRSVRRSMRGIRREHARGQYDVEMATLPGDTSTPKEHSESPQGNEDSELNTSDIRPMVVPLLCVSTPNLNAVNKLDISSIDLRKLQTMSLSTLPRPSVSVPTSPNTSTIEPSHEDTVPETSTENTTDSIEIIDESDC